MKLKTLLTFVTVLAMSFTVASAADEDTPLSKQMSGMNKSLRTLKRNLADPAKKQENLDLLKKINEAVVEACKLEPKFVKDKPNKPELMAKYKEQMDALGKSFAELETALKADDQDAAKKIFEKLTEQKEAGHKDFEVD